MLAIEPGRLHGAEEELRAVGVRAGVGHGQDAGTGVLEGEILVRKLVTVDGFAAGAVSPREVAALAHEVDDDPVERAALEVQGLPRLARALLARAQAPEVLRGLGGNVRPQLHGDAARIRTADGHVKV